MLRKGQVEEFGWCFLILSGNFSERVAFAGETLVLGVISLFVLILLSLVWFSNFFLFLNLLWNQ